MADGILIGKCSDTSRNKVPTFFLNRRMYYYGCGNGSTYAYKIKTCTTSQPGSGMFQAAPVIIAYWSDEE